MFFYASWDSPAAAAKCINFFGMHPTFTQVPRKERENVRVISQLDREMFIFLLCFITS